VSHSEVNRENCNILNYYTVNCLKSRNVDLFQSLLNPFLCTLSLLTLPFPLRYFFIPLSNVIYQVCSEHSPRCVRVVFALNFDNLRQRVAPENVSGSRRKSNPFEDAMKISLSFSPTAIPSGSCFVRPHPHLPIPHSATLNHLTTPIRNLTVVHSQPFFCVKFVVSSLIKHPHRLHPGSILRAPPPRARKGALAV
jgi:hypothetical protein